MNYAARAGWVEVWVRVRVVEERGVVVIVVRVVLRPSGVLMGRSFKGIHGHRTNNFASRKVQTNSTNCINITIKCVVL